MAYRPPSPRRWLRYSKWSVSALALSTSSVSSLCTCAFHIIGLITVLSPSVSSMCSPLVLSTSSVSSLCSPHRRSHHCFYVFSIFNRLLPPRLTCQRVQCLRDPSPCQRVRVLVSASESLPARPSPASAPESLPARAVPDPVLVSASGSRVLVELNEAFV